MQDTTRAMKAIPCLGLVLVLLLWSAQAAAQPQCPGDLNGDVRVTVDEVLTSVNHVLNECPVRLTDNGDGTISDNWTGLMWEKKSGDLGSIHYVLNKYTWSSAGSEPDGTVFTDFLATLNDTAFAGYTDWRLPTIEELLGIVDFERSGPAIGPVFDANCNASGEGCTVTECSCTAVFGLGPLEFPAYWSSTTQVAFRPEWAWTVWFGDGVATHPAKVAGEVVRAVRDGL